jgi:hypothetical protein
MNATETQIELHGIHSDVYKEVHNIRPRWLRPADHTVEEWQAMIDRLVEEGQEAVRQERAAEVAHQSWAREVTACEPLRVPMAVFMTR